MISIRKTAQWLIAAMSILGCDFCIALPFSIVPNETLPTIVLQGGTVTATYTVTNNTDTTLTNNFIKYLPPYVAQTTGAGLCGTTFTLTNKGTPGDTCTLGFTISGPVNSQDPNPHNHLFVCANDGITCAGTDYPLNVTQVSSVLYAGTENGNIYYSINNGSTWTIATPPSQTSPGNNAVYGIFATNTTLYVNNANDSYVNYSTNNGVSWQQTSAAPDSTAVFCVFSLAANNIAIGTEGGNIYLSQNNGASWNTALTKPSAGHAVNSIFLSSSSVMYAGSADGNVYHSVNGGTAWTAINGSADGSAVMSVYVVNNLLYINTANEYAYIGSSSGGSTWIPFAQTVYSLFVSSDGSVIDAGTQGGYVFSLSTGNELGFVTYSPINSVFFLNGGG